MAKTNSSRIGDQKEETTWTDFMNLIYLNRGKVAWLFGGIALIFIGGSRWGEYNARNESYRKILELRIDHAKEVSNLKSEMILIKIDRNHEVSSSLVIDSLR